MEILYPILLIIIYIFSRQWNTLFHELGHAFFILKFTTITNVILVIGFNNKSSNPIYEKGRLKIYYSLFSNSWKSGHCIFDDKESFTLNEYILIVLGGPLSSLIMTIFYSLLYIFINSQNQIILMFLSILFLTSLSDFIINILPINLSKKIEHNSFTFIENDGYLLKQLLDEKFLLNKKIKFKKTYNRKFTINPKLSKFIKTIFIGTKIGSSSYNIPKYSYKDFLPFFSKDRFDPELKKFINKFGEYKLQSQFYQNDIAYFEEENTFIDYYSNEYFGFDLLFENISFRDAITGYYPDNLVLSEIIFYLENLNQKNPIDNFLTRADVTTTINQAFPDRFFNGYLPGNISIVDNKETIIEKLGLPTKSDQINKFDIFLKQDDRLTIKVVYKENSNNIKFVTLSPIEHSISSSITIKP